MWWHYKYGLSPLAPPPPPGIHSLTLTEEMTPFVNGETESQKSCDLPKTTQLGGRGFQIVTILPSPWKTVFPWWVKAPRFFHSKFGKLTLCNDRGMPEQSSWDPTLRWAAFWVWDREISKQKKTDTYGTHYLPGMVIGCMCVLSCLVSRANTWGGYSCSHFSDWETEAQLN